MANEALQALSIGAPFAVGLAGLGPAVGISLMTAAYFNSSARQPEIQGKLFVPYIITLGVVELLGLFGFVTFYLIFQKAGA
jgi:F-type H+-transporting ATPase subunit c